jgi:L-histidine N-alpha-methyltransferase
MSLAHAAPVLPAAAHTPLGAEVLRGLTARPKTLSPWIFYDARGSELFEQITALPEYYLTRTERAIFREHAPEILAAAAGNRRVSLIELGAGTATKTGLLLQAALRRQQGVAYCALDVSASALEEARAGITAQFPGVTVETRVADYTEDLAAIQPGNNPASSRLVLYIGSSIGNFDPVDATALLRRVRQRLAPGDHILLGADHAPGNTKDAATLLRAYDDAAGVTAAFNRNALVRINRELHADFDLHAFRHAARWNPLQSRMEMHLESTRRQRVSISALGLELDFSPGETIHTENSYKFTPHSISALLAQGGFTVTHSWTDARRWFGVYLAAASLPQ